MQLIVNGSQTHVLQVAPEANVAQLRAQLSMLEGVDCEQLNLFRSAWRKGARILDSCWKS